VPQHGLLNMMANRVGRAVQLDKRTTHIGARTRPPPTIRAVVPARPGHLVTLRR
jgi:hypothetical protein